MRQAARFPDATAKAALESGARRLRIAIATNGRFHVLDLARELDALGHEVRFYSWVPRRMALSYGLPARCHVNLLPLLAPLVAWQRFSPRVAPTLRERLITEAIDRTIAAVLEPCDVFIGMSGLILNAARAARRNHGAQIYLERGSRHILSQREILSDRPSAGPSDYTVSRELAGYALADRIAIPSSQVAESFARDPPAEAKLFVNPYGVDLDMFPERMSLPANEPKTVLAVGGWTYRKGADVLTQAIRSLDGVRLLHVGPLVDTPFPKDARFTHVDAVPQHRLAAYYSQAHVFALASREEGLALVQAQALAVGLPLVCTDRTGGIDLAHSPGLAERISVVPHGNPQALRDALARALRTAETLAPLLPADRASLSWRAYGERYSAELLG